MDKNFIEKWEKIFSENKFEMFTAIILYNLSCSENYNNLSIDEKIKILNYTYEFYLKDESCLYLGKITDTVMEHYKEILEGKIDRAELYNYINY